MSGLGHFVWFLFIVIAMPLQAQAERKTEGGYESLPLEALIPFCIFSVVMCAFYCGLTLGLLSTDTTTLEIIADAGPEPDCTYARKILPVRRLGHQLLVTLLLGNMLFAVLTSQLIAATINSTELVNFIVGTLVILIFGEIIPMSICIKGNNVLLVGSKCISALQVSLILLYPIAKPLGMILDCVISHEAGQLYGRNELKKLISVHCDKYSEKSGIDSEQVRMMLRVLDLNERIAKSVMTPLKDVFMVDGSMVLNRNLLKSLWEIGKSRYPVYIGEKTNIVGLLYVKDLLNFCLHNHKESITVHDFIMQEARDTVVVDDNFRIQQILAIFKNRSPLLLLVTSKTKTASDSATAGGRSPNALTSVNPGVDIAYREGSVPSASSQLLLSLSNDRPNVKNPNETFVGIITLEDVIEELIASEIYDEDEYEQKVESEEPAGPYLTAPLSKNITSSPPIEKLHVNFYSYGVEEGEKMSCLSKDLTEEQKWTLASYMTRMFIAFATLSNIEMKHLIEHVGDRVVHVSEDSPLRGEEDAVRTLYQAGVPATNFTILLGGRVLLTMEKEKLSTELYSFSSLAEEALLWETVFVPSYSAIVTRSSRLIQISKEDLRIFQTKAFAENKEVDAWSLRESSG